MAEAAATTGFLIDQVRHEMHGEVAALRAIIGELVTRINALEVKTSRAIPSPDAASYFYTINLT